ncbi:DUF4388 domain-containing protein [Polyangium aurulentum]|uniref:DUF4388 domain-containing protein n=1 Tax=Polyangium aurulentum TaxID=2567896 RepID=UPI0010AEE4AF|nr:DUF4388 domain-containing protein [Polyangium aurulentum]UQA56514.1 DUF4388 domain-containing protein [Polyangium aurulentum]
MAEDGHDLVRVDGTGTAHPVGKVASQRMRARQGAFRLMPSPPHVVVMRRVTEDGKPLGPEGNLKLSGEITSAGALCDIVSLIGQTGWTGELAVLDGQATRSVFFEGGNVVSAQSTAEGERLGEVLFRYGALTQEQVAEVAKAVTNEVRFGEAAVKMGLLSREKLFSLVSQQVEEIVYAAVRVGQGMFYFLDRYDESRLTSRQNLPVSALLMEAVRRMDEMRYFRERIPSDQHVPDRVPERGPPSEEELEPIWEVVDGGMTVAEICRVLGESEFEVTRKLFQLVQAGCVTVRAPRPTGPAAIVALFNEAMKMVLREVDAVKRGDEVRQHLSSFATGAGIYDALFQRAGPAHDGTLDAERILENVQVLVGPEQAEAMLAQWLYDYVSFAIFIAEPVLREAPARAGGASLAKNVADIMAPLAPTH